MRNRCHNPNFRQFKDYGGRGLGICPEWDSFAQFSEDMGPKPSPLHSLDRIDNDLGYSPENCRWATKKEQQRNRRGAIFVTIEGAQHRVADLAEKTGIEHKTLIKRAKYGLSLSDILAGVRIPRMNSQYVNGKLKTHCSRGHEFTEENTYGTAEGWRTCRTCHRAKVNRQNAAKKALRS